MDPFRTPLQPPGLTSPTCATPKPAVGLLAGERLCAVCAKPISGRKEKKVCSGKCRITLCRQRRHDALLERLRVAEDALAHAAAAIAALREVAALGPHATATLAAKGA